MSQELDYKFGLLGWRVQVARELAFVGRQRELAVFRTALHGAGCSVLYVHGPGGIGKSALLRRFAQEAASAGRSVTRIDGARSVLSPAAFAVEAEPALRDAHAVLLIDAFEQIRSLEGWLRESFLPGIPLGTLVVIAGRLPPDMHWQADPGWAGAMEVMPLPALAPEETRVLLDCCDVPDALREPLQAFAGGHPLALLLGAAAKCDRSNGPSLKQEITATLLDRMVGEVPSPVHQRALEICAHAYVTTEDLLRAVLQEDAGTVFRWLRRLPFVESNSLGLFPHDVVREWLEADFRWRDPQGHAEMRDRIHAHLTEKVRTVPDPDVLGAVGALLHLHRGNGAGIGLRDAYKISEVQEAVLRPEDVGTLLRIAAAAEGDASAACAAFWVERQPEAFRVYRQDGIGEPVAFSAWLRLPEPREEESAADPVVAGVWSHARATAPLRADEHLAVARVWVAPSCRGDASAIELLHWRTVGNCLRTERMARSYIAIRDSTPSIDEHFRHYGMDRIAERPRLGDATYSLFAHDWRAMPAQVWLERLNRLNRSQATDTGAASVELAVLSRTEFTEAVRQALRQISRMDVLAASPLTRTRLVTERGGRHGRDPAAALHDLLRQAIGDLREDPRSVKFHRALSVTFLSGTPTQQLAAEQLGLPFTTYRRHLTAGIERVCADLWHYELYGAGAGADRSPEPARRE
ncbi:AAA ATPase domain-containing protein [Sinosporangium album]|uniref:AAA ATPase domain-containing protein n=1 Tax=Sinosporangium album TaxID=504805 RepID=A0A1G8JB95_9ACTN|nr:ATP-binding protein [Sinosporangium album]SDI28515.1 AAA ATPase domain-containing protein [Sinosporangium album]